MRLRIYGLVGIAILAVVTGQSEAASQKKTEMSGKMSAGMKCQADWVKRFRETHDPRVFMMLASRVGRHPNLEECAAMCEMFKKDESKREKFLKEWGITRDVKTYNAECVAKWKEKYGEEALVFKTTNYYMFGTKDNTVILTFLKYYMEKMFSFYRKQFPAKEKLGGRFLIYMYPDRAEYLATGAPGFSGAYFSGAERKLVGYIEPAYRKHRKWIADTRISTFFHEGFHQYLGYFVPNPPIWLNEGGAMISETISVDGKSLKSTGHMSYEHGMTMQAALKKGVHTPLKDFLYLSSRGFYSNPNLHYPQGWSFSHFLKFGPKKYRGIPDAIIASLLDGLDEKEAIDNALSGIDIAELEKDWLDYVKKLDVKKQNNTYYYPRQ